VLLFQWQGETVDDGSKNLKKLGDTVKALRLVDELKEDVVDGAANVGP
jgi:hypothetical protein